MLLFFEEKQRYLRSNDLLLIKMVSILKLKTKSQTL